MKYLDRRRRGALIPLESLVQIASLGLALHVGIAIGHSRPAEVRTVYVPIRIPAPVPESTALLPTTGERMPKFGTPEAARRARAMGLEPADVDRFARMMKLTK